MTAPGQVFNVAYGFLCRKILGISAGGCYFPLDGADKRAGGHTRGEDCWTGRVQIHAGSRWDSHRAGAIGGGRDGNPMHSRIFRVVSGG
jgi:hypothetical protein